MVGDLTYDDELLAGGALPGRRPQATDAQVTRLVNALRDTLPGLVVLPAHDPHAAQRLETALEPTAADATETILRAVEGRSA